MPKKLTITDFIERAKGVHGDRYDYSKAEYVNNTTNIIIVCPEHGEFEQTPKSHFKGNGCPDCGLISRGEKRKLTTTDFIERAKGVHGDRYDYSIAEYFSAKSKVKIICPEHGVFEQIAYNHANGTGCPACGIEKRTDSLMLGNDSFLKKARKIHGLRYDYTQVEYVDSHTDIKIICKDHGPFWQAATTHLSGAGCPACSGVERLDTDKFIQRAREIHGDRYDYSCVNYKNNKTKVKIICSEHGVYEQNPSNHLQGLGCILCGYKNAGQYHKKDTSSFIDEAKALHGNYYDYSLTKYRGARDKLTIVCPIHGPFEQVAHVHLRGEPGSGCLKCSYENRADNARMDFDEFIKRSKKKHNDFYNYSISKEQYLDLSTKITINCPKHGKFEQTGANHVNGKGCPKCGVERGATAQTKSTEEFLSEARRMHGDKYDYSKTEYINSKTNVTIICPDDGEFEQLPEVHLGSIGCPKCSRRNQGAPRNLTRALRGEFDQTREAYVYVVSFRFPCSDAALYKIGSGTGTRINKVQNELRHVGGTVTRVEQYQFSSMGEAIVFEHLAHNQVSDYQYVVPVDLKFPGHTEVFSKKPNLKAVQEHATLAKFRSGDRWDPRKE